jgi:hypothetical protein
VHSNCGLKQPGFVFLPSRAYAQGIATAAAMLVCGAVVLNVGPFAKTPTAAGPAASAGPTVQPVAQMESGSKLDAPAEVAAADPPAFQLADVKSVAEPVSASPQPIPSPPLEIVPTPAALAAQADRDRQNAERAAIVGVWAPDAGTCSAREFRDGVLPTVITNEGAWAGETFCIFTKRAEVDRGWKAVAKCSTSLESWTAHVRLKINDNRLIWTSERGTQAYSRCGPDVLMAAR